MDRYAIIVAGGKGTRMKSDVPKQFLLLDQEPILVKTVKAFLSASVGIEVIVVLPKEHLEDWETIKTKYFSEAHIQTTIGGSTRTDSVIAGLSQIPDSGLVAIHDAVRPFVSTEVINNAFESAKNEGSGVAAVPLKDSIREVRKDGLSMARDRANYVLMQTPQTFRVEEIKSAYQQIDQEVSYTDDATVYEAAGFDVTLIEGSYANIKITTPEDLN